MIDLPKLVRSIGVKRLRAYRVLKLELVPKKSHGINGHIVVATVSPELWRLVIEAEPFTYPRRLIALYAELISGLNLDIDRHTALIASESVALARSMLIGQEADDEGLLEVVWEREADGRHYIEVEPRPPGAVEMLEENDGVVPDEVVQAFGGLWFAACVNRYTWFRSDVSSSWVSFIVRPEPGVELTEEDYYRMAIATFGWNVVADQTAGSAAADMQMSLENEPIASVSVAIS